MIATAILLLIAGFANAVMDVISFYWSTSVFNSGKTGAYKFTDPSVSWKNKYKDGIVGKGPAFWGATTVFVWLTDLWHLSKSVMLLCFALAVVLFAMPGFTDHWLLNLAISFAIAKLSFSFSFNLFMKILHNKK